jgi:hypothetical protein
VPVFDNLGLAEPSTITAVVATVTITRGSTVENQEILVLGDPETSNALARVLNATPASTTWAVAVREVAPSTQMSISSVAGTVTVDGTVSVTGYVAPSTVITVSTGSVRVHQSSAADLNVTVAGYVAPSTIVAVSSLGGVVTVSPTAGSTWAVRALQSSAADLQVTATQGGTWNIGTVTTVTGVSSVAGVVTVTPSAGSTFTVRAMQSSAADLNVTVAGYSTLVAVSSVGGAVIVRSSAADFNATVTPAAGSTWATRPLQSSAADLQMTATPAAGSTWNVRALQSSAADLQVTATIATPWDSTFISGNKGTSGDTIIFSSAASTRFAITGYHFTMASTTPTLVRLVSSQAGGSTTEMARWLFQAPSSAAVGANLAVGMPGYLYRGAIGAAIILNTDSTATVHYTVTAYKTS